MKGTGRAIFYHDLLTPPPQSLSWTDGEFRMTVHLAKENQFCFGSAYSCHSALPGQVMQPTTSLYVATESII